MPMEAETSTLPRECRDSYRQRATFLAVHRPRKTLLLTLLAWWVESDRHRVQGLACAILAGHDCVPFDEGRSPCSNWS